MAFFDDLTTLLKQKWLQFFQDNRSWIALQMQVEAVYTPDGGRRPASYFILGVVNALEPQLAQLMLPFLQLNPDADALIEVLELNFDPDIVLGNLVDTQTDILMSALIEVEPDEVSESLEEMADEVVLVTDEEPSLVLTEIGPDELSNMSLDQIAAAMGLAELEQEPHETLNAALTKQKLDNEPPETPAVQTNPQEDVLSDVWADTNSESAPANEQQSEHDKEIFRLFPNS